MKKRRVTELPAKDTGQKDPTHVIQTWTTVRQFEPTITGWTTSGEIGPREREEER